MAGANLQEAGAMDSSLSAAPPLAELHTHDRHSRLGLGAEDLLGMYRTMVLARTLDTKMWSLNRMGRAPFVIPEQGHEGAQVGSAWVVRPGHDYVLPYYRDLAVVLTIGMTPYEIMLGALAKAPDPCSGGRQMPNHWGCSRLRIITGSSPIATHLPHAAGIAYQLKQSSSEDVAVCYFGDGATSKGDFHEALNFAGIHKLPVVFVCENNGYAISVPLDKESAVANIAERASGYGIPGVIADGTDVLDVYETMHAAVERARQGEGATLVECKTYRFLAHTSDDDDRSYRSREEVDAWRRRDPLTMLKRYLIEQRLLPESLEQTIAREVADEVEQATARAEAEPDPSPEEAFTKVWARPIRLLDRDPGPSTGGTPEESAEMNVIEAVRFALRSAMEDDERVLVLGEDVGRKGGVFGATKGLVEDFGEARVLDTPLAESAIVGIAIGLALVGRLPVAEIQFADFIHSAFDQIVSEAARIHYRSNGDFCVPMVIRAPYGGGIHGALYHSQSIEAFFAHVPGLKVVVPSTPADVAGMLRAAIEDPDPVLFLEHKKTYRAVRGTIPLGQWRVPIGKAEVARHGDDLCIVTYGYHRHVCLEAAEALAPEASIEVVDLRTVSPLDRETVLESARRCGRVLVVHEDNLSFGAGAEIAAMVAEEAFWDLDAPVRRLAMADVPAMPYAPSLEAAVSIDVQKVVNAARCLLAT
jgi:2-oxoisovalerate dehydrogenase E1 component